MPADQQFLNALTDLWNIPAPGPKNILSIPEFGALNELCAQRYSDGKITIGGKFALGRALRSLGLPCWQAPNTNCQSLDLQSVADSLVDAFSRKTVIRRHICPLDLAVNFPSVSFGNARIENFTKEGLEGLFDSRKLALWFPTLPFESEKLAQFNWLVVEEEITVHLDNGVRTFPFFPDESDIDRGDIEPHAGRVPKAVEDALFFILQLPWEQWEASASIDWRGFRMPWVYTQDDDLFVFPSPPPRPESLSFEPAIYEDENGEEIETERPITLWLAASEVTEIKSLTHEAWQKLRNARTTELFETPVVHFLVRAFLANGIDEFMAHLIVIEAAFGIHGDPKLDLLKKMRIKPSLHVAFRLSAALGENVVCDYDDLFKLRSRFIHGRSGLEPISLHKRILARRLARLASCKLVSLALTDNRRREKILRDLLSKGINNFHSELK
ncbi:hypothetical protein [Advenella mimigardefordensis]|uniref:Apea-like HEPN domain-containing protein n=1 Tax=Advenella mimigardefordensis (strain DSM 17166 / LMG 22922 / DPN7) TaxID=1247726 RepID=W0PBT0_ADVMD|nr:hypothetical protein [Advenella mimigardefordensis]AHG62875.1 hypothetical protein MIM_c07760 [Advenella mimigardefordensis DPN7]